MTEIFVFGSNLAGRHGAGSAKHAVQHCGAIYGQGVGPQGASYAIPTKDEKLAVLPLEQIRHYVWDFISYAEAHPELTFRVVAIGTGLAGYRHEDMAPFFKHAPKNCMLPPEWVEIHKAGDAELDELARISQELGLD